MIPDFKFYFITDRKLCPEFDLLNIISRVCESGVRAIQLREKDLSTREVFDLAKRAQQICQPAGCKLLINERFDIALAAGADGVHLSAKGIPADIVRRQFPAGKLIGTSVHSIEEALKAERQNCDFILYGPVFFTPSKTKFGPPQGLAELEKVVKAVRIPVFAVGGITPEKARKCIGTGAHGVAAISSVINSPNLPETVQQFWKALGNL